MVQVVLGPTRRKETAGVVIVRLVVVCTMCRIKVLLMVRELRVALCQMRHVGTLLVVQLLLVRLHVGLQRWVPVRVMVG